MTEFNPTIKCREGDDIYTAFVVLPEDWATRSDGPLAVTDDDRRGDSTLDSFKLVCGGRSYSLVKTTTDGQARLTLQGQSEVSFDPDEYAYFYLKGDKLQPVENAGALQSIMHPASTTIQTAPTYRFAGGIRYVEITDQTSNLPNILPNDGEYDSVVLGTPSEPTNKGAQLMLRADAFLPFENKDGNPLWSRWVPFFLSANLLWTFLSGTPEEERMSKEGEEGNLHTLMFGIGPGLSLGRVVDAMGLYDAKGLWDVFILTDFVGAYDLRINANIAGRAPATDSVDRRYFFIGDAPPNFIAGANLMLFGKWGIEAAGSYTLFKDVPGREDLQVWAVGAGVAYADRGSITKKETIEDRPVQYSRFVTPMAAPPPEEPAAPVLVAPPPPEPPAPFVYTERKPMPVPEFTADAAETFESGSAELKDGPGNAQVKSFVNFLEDTTKFYKGIGIDEVAFDVEIEANADSVGDADYNLALSNQRADSFKSGVMTGASSLSSTKFTLNYGEATGKGETEPVGFACAKPKKCEAGDIKDSSQLAIIPANESDLKPTAPFFKADGSRGGRYKDPEVKNGGYGQVCVGSGRSMQCYLQDFKASRNVKATVEMNRIPQLDRLAGDAVAQVYFGAGSAPSGTTKNGDVTSYLVQTTEATTSPQFAITLKYFYSNLADGNELTMVIALPGTNAESDNAKKIIDAADIVSQYFTKGITGKPPVKIIVTTDKRFPRQGIYIVTAPKGTITAENIPEDVQNAWLDM